MSIKFFSLHSDYSTSDTMDVMTMADIFKKLDKETKMKNVDDLHGSHVVYSEITPVEVQGASHQIKLRKGVAFVFEAKNTLELTEKDGKKTTLNYVGGELKVNYTKKVNLEKTKVSELDKKILTWLDEGKSGASSLFMCKKIFPKIKHPDLEGLNSSDHPYDPSDLNRCINFLNQVPEARTHLNKVAKAGVVWKSLIENWSTLENQLLEEKNDHTLDGKAPKTYDLIKGLIDQAHSAKKKVKIK